MTGKRRTRAAKPKGEAKAAQGKQPVWKSKAALAGGLAAVGAAATAALLSLRGSTPKTDGEDKPAPAKSDSDASAAVGGETPPVATNPNGHAHMPDGEDATKSFNAGIADENVIPE